MNTNIPDPFNNQLDEGHVGPSDVWTYYNSRGCWMPAWTAAGSASRC